MKSLMILTSMCFSLALAQPQPIGITPGIGTVSAPGGRIDAKAIPERVFNGSLEHICNGIRQTIRDRAKEDAMRELNVTVTKDDLAKTQLHVKPLDTVAEAERLRTHGIAATPDGISKQIEANLQRRAQLEKLQATVDQLLADQDAKFRTALEHWNASEQVNTTEHSIGHIVPEAEKEYMETSREAFWKGRESRLQVVLNDPKLAASCNVGVR